jgi:hypothetical protein
MNEVYAEAFFGKFIEGYLVSDLNRLNKLRQREGAGNCAYLILQLSLTGFDLIGSLVTNKLKLGQSGSRYFDEFIEKFMSEIDQNYVKSKTILWKSMRNKLAHSYLTYDFVVVYKGKGARAIEHDKRETHIYCKNLVKDFNVAVAKVREQMNANSSFKELVGKNAKAILHDLSINENTNGTTKELHESLAGIRASIFENSARGSGASLSTLEKAPLSAAVLSFEEIREFNKKNTN